MKPFGPASYGMIVFFVLLGVIAVVSARPVSRPASMPASAALWVSAAQEKAMIARYEALAREQQAIIERHAKMKADRKKELASKRISVQVAAEGDLHCDSERSAAALKKEEYLSFAHFHRVILASGSVH